MLVILAGDPLWWIHGGVVLREPLMEIWLHSSRHTDMCDLDKPSPAGLIEGISVTFCVWSSRDGRSEK